MTDHIDPKARNIENTFMPNLINKWLSVNGVIASLQRGFCEFDDLPKDVKEKVNIIVEQRLQESNTKSKNSISKDTLEEMK